MTDADFDAFYDKIIADALADQCAVTLTQTGHVLCCHKEPGHVELGDHWHRDQKIEWDDGEADPKILCEIIVGEEPAERVTTT